MTPLEKIVFAALWEALEDVAQTLAWMQHGKCRGFSPRLLTTQDALDKASKALSKAENLSKTCDLLGVEIPITPSTKEEIQKNIKWLESIK